MVVFLTCRLGLYMCLYFYDKNITMDARDKVWTKTFVHSSLPNFFNNFTRWDLSVENVTNKQTFEHLQKYCIMYLCRNWSCAWPKNHIKASAWPSRVLHENFFHYSGKPSNFFTSADSGQTNCILMSVGKNCLFFH